MSPHLLLFPILFPIVCGVALLFRPDLPVRTRNALVEAAACVDTAAVAVLLTFARRTPAVVYRFLSGFVVSFRVDGCAALFAGMVALMWPLALLYAFEYMEHEERQGRFFAFYLMTYGVTLGVAFSADLITMYVFFEMLTLVTIPLVVHYQDPDSVYAGRLYIGYCVAGASLAFFAVVMATLDGGGGFRYGGNLVGVFDQGLMRIIYLFGFFGFGTKAAVFPLSEWLPKASVAPTPVTALLHAVAVVNSGVFAVARLTWYAFGPRVLAGTWVRDLCVLTAGVSMVFAAGMALRQRHFKRRLAWSTVSNLSYILFGIALLSPEGLQGALAHMLFHGITKMGLFLCAGAFMHVTGNAYLYEIDGAGRSMPFTFSAYTIGALSLTGVPLLCCFVSKWRLLTAGIEAGGAAALIGTAALVIAAFLCAMYSLTVSRRAFFPGDGTEIRYPPGIREGGWRMLLPIGVFTVLDVLLGVWSGPAMAWLGQIAHGAM